MSGALAKDPLVKVPEDWFSIGVLGHDSGTVVAAVAAGPLGELLELAGGVRTVVPALTAATLALVLEMPLEAVVKSAFRTG